MAETPAKPGQAGQERDLAAERVDHQAPEQQQAAERQGVGGDHPLQVHGSEVQRPLRGRQRDVCRITVRSSTTMSCARPITARMSHRRRSQALSVDVA